MNFQRSVESCPLSRIVSSFHLDDASVGFICFNIFSQSEARNRADPFKNQLTEIDNIYFFIFNEQDEAFAFFQKLR